MLAGGLLLDGLSAIIVSLKVTQKSCFFVLFCITDNSTFYFNGVKIRLLIEVLNERL